jgi:DNA repair protein RecN (Recombination protein N)
MLIYLRIKDFALIDSLELELSPGLTVLTGETGAGKSIVLSAMNLLMGGRAAADLIRAGAEQAVVEAQFALPADSPVLARLAEDGLREAGAADELVIRRVVNREGRNRVQVDGGLATLGLLGEIGPQLVSICGQHAQQALLRPEEHLSLLDAFAGLDGQRQRVGEAVAQVREMDRRMEGLRQALAQREARREILLRAVREIEDAALDPAEEDALKQERKLLANAEQLATLAELAYQGLYAAEEGSTLETLGKVRGIAGDLARLDERLAPLAASLEEAFYTIEEAARQVGDYAARVSQDPARLDQVEARLLAIQRVSRKHGGDVEAALKTLEAARDELATLESGEEGLARLGRERQAALNEALGLAKELSRARQAAAGKLARAARAELKDLGLAACEFETRLEPPAAGALDTPEGPLSARGLEQAEFYIAPNPGEGFRRLTRIASGGELSRILLALKSLVAQSAGAPTLVFDEVDAGIGGATGAAVGRKLARLATGAQVLCITHLPQIAAWGGDHLSARKHTAEGRTATRLLRLDDQGRLEEVTRMLAGDEDAAAAQSHARQMLAAARAGRG